MYFKYMLKIYLKYLNIQVRSFVITNKEVFLTSGRREKKMSVEEGETERKEKKK